MEGDRSKPRHSGVYFPPPLLYAIAFGAGILLHARRPLAIADWPPMERGGMAVMIAAALLAVWSIASFWRRRTSIVPIKPSTSLVVDGPFRFSRNPMYLALAIAYIGGALALNSLWPIIFLPVLIVAVDRLIIEKEERYMQSVFGEAYAIYCARVRRWL